MKKLFIIIITTVLSCLLFISIGMSIWVLKENNGHSDGNILVEGVSKVGTITVKDRDGNTNTNANFRLIFTQNDIYLDNQPIITFKSDIPIENIDFKYRVMVPTSINSQSNIPLDEYIYVTNDTLKRLPTESQNGYNIYEGVWHPTLDTATNTYKYNGNFAFGYRKGKEPTNNVKFYKDTFNSKIVRIEFYALEKGSSIN